MDLSPLRKFEVLGPDAEMLIQRAITRNARKLSVGQVTYTAVCNETGGMLDDATVYRLADDNFRFVAGDPYTGVHLTKLAEAESMRVWVKPSTDQLHNLSVQGPRSREILRQIVWAPPTQPALEDLRWFRFLIGRIGDYDGIPIVVSRTGLHRRARLRGLVPSRRRPRRLGRDLGGRIRPRAQTARPLGARHAADRVGADLRRLRVRRPGRPVRGRYRLRGLAGRGRRRLRRQGGADRPQGAPAARRSSASSWPATRWPGTATACMSAARRSA